jgi:hypothetical protein
MVTQASNHELINYIDDNAFLRHLLAHMERNIQDVFIEIVYSFAHLPLSANECLWYYISLRRWGVVLCNLMLGTGTEVNLLSYDRNNNKRNIFMKQTSTRKFLRQQKFSRKFHRKPAKI